MVKANNFKPAINGQDVYTKLMEAVSQNETYKKLQNELSEEEFKNIFGTLENSIRKLAYNQTAAAYSSSVDGTGRITQPDYETFGKKFLAKKLKENPEFSIGATSSEDIEIWFKEFAAQLYTLFPHTRNQTPHPTETSSPAMIEAEVNLAQLLRTDMRKLLTDGSEKFVMESHQANFDEKIDALLEGITTPPATGFAVRNEMAMSLRQSRLTYKSVPEDLVALHDVAVDVFGLNADDEKIREWILDASAQAVRNETWSPGDCDSKPHMRPAQMRQGIRMGQLAIRQQYIEDLAEIAAELDSGDPQSKEALEEIQSAIWKLFNEIENIYENDPQKAKEKIDRFVTDTLASDGVSPLAQDVIKKIYADRYESAMEDSLNAIRDIKQAIGHAEKAKAKNEEHQADVKRLKDTLQNLRENFNKIHQESYPYLKKITDKAPDKDYEADRNILIEKIEQIAGYDAVKAIKYTSAANGKKTKIRAIDALSTQIKSYGFQAQRITHRQAADVYERAAKNLITLVNQRFGDEGVNITDIKGLIELLTNENNKELADNIRREVQQEKNKQMAKVLELQELQDKDEIQKFTPEQLDIIQTYESLEMVQIGMYEGRGAVERELIAELNKPEDLWNVLAFQELMKDPDNLPEANRVPMIVPLVEYTDDILKVKEITDKAFEFEPFKQSQKALSSPENMPHLNMWDKEQNKLRPMTVGDLLDQIAEQYKDWQPKYGEEAIDFPQWVEDTKQKLKDEAPEGIDPLQESVFHYVIMGAGSDSNKSSSLAFVTAMKKSMMEGQLNLSKFGALAMQKMGGGSSLHRNAITQALIRTRQGREMWRGPEIQAAETENIRASAAARQQGIKLRVGGYARDVAITNLANRAGLADITSNDEFQNMFKRDEERVEAYRGFYEYSKENEEGITEPVNPAFSKFVDIATPRKLLGVFKYAARPANRLRAAGDFNVEEGIRAIGYGLSTSATFRPPHLHLGLAGHVMMADENGFIRGTETVTNQEGKEVDVPVREKIMARYLKSPDLQNQINRAMADIIHYNPELSWKNTATGLMMKDVKRSVNQETGEVTITFGEGDAQVSYSLQKLANLQGQDKALFESKLSTLRDESFEKNSKTVSAKDMADIVITAATLDLECTKSRRAINQLVSDLVYTANKDKSKKERVKEARALRKQDKSAMFSRKIVDKEPLSVAEADDTGLLLDNITRLSPALGSELQEEYKVEAAALKKISDIFRRTQQDPSTMPVKSSKPVEKDFGDDVEAYQKKLASYERYASDYQAFKQHIDIIESAPAAYHMPGHAAAVAKAERKTVVGIAE
jgi:hypothetical protein